MENLLKSLIGRRFFFGLLVTGAIATAGVAYLIYDQTRSLLAALAWAGAALAGMFGSLVALRASLTFRLLLPQMRRDVRDVRDEVESLKNRVSLVERRMARLVVDLQAGDSLTDAILDQADESAGDRRPD